MVRGKARGKEATRRVAHVAGGIAFKDAIGHDENAVIVPDSTSLVIDEQQHKEVRDTHETREREREVTGNER